jgi:hypothetical protein
MACGGLLMERVNYLSAVVPANVVRIISTIEDDMAVEIENNKARRFGSAHRAALHA